jgi:ATP-binding cassette subfamily F protein uup
VISQPDLLLMDEPTNHLDMEGIEWLEKQLAPAPFAFVVVSHDRYFLERVTNRVVELNPRYPDGYFSVAGSYGTFLDKRADFLEAQQAQEAALANIVRREAAFLKSQAKARRTKSKSRIEDAYRLQGELRDLQQRNVEKAGAAIDFHGSGRKSKLLLEATGLGKSLGGRTLFQNLDVSLGPGTRLGVLGGNGSGKTTLLRVIGGELPPDTGLIRTADDLRVAIFDQKRESLPQDQALRRALAAEGDSVDFRGQTVHISAWAQRFLFRMEQLNLPVGELSGGEQARVLIARLMLRPADLLILDEPTNDLDISSLDILEESLMSFAGAVVLVTHDRFMLDRICDEVIGLDGNGNAGRYADCSQWLRARERQPASESVQALEKDDQTGADPVPTSPRKRLRGALTASEESELKEMEERIQEAEDQVAACQQAMDDPAIATDAEETAKRWRELTEARATVDALYTRWEELEAKSKREPA